MTVAHEMNTTAKKFFDLLLTSVQDDIKRATGSSVELKDLKTGYTYEKNLLNKMGKEGKATTTLINIKEPSEYEAEFLSSRGKNTVECEPPTTLKGRGF